MQGRNWSEYNKHLIQQGSISFFIDSKVFRSMQHDPKSKRTIAVDAETGEIVAECTTEATVADSAVSQKLLDKIPGKIKLVMADGAYDRSSCREVIKKRKAKALIPPPKNARYRGTDSERDQAIAAIRGLGGDKEARSIWAKLSGYSYRVLVESVFSRKKRLFGDRLFSKHFDKQCVENTARCLLLNQMRMEAALPYLR